MPNIFTRMSLGHLVQSTGSYSRRLTHRKSCRTATDALYAVLAIMVKKESLTMDKELSSDRSRYSIIDNRRLGHAKDLIEPESYMVLQAETE